MSAGRTAEIEIGGMSCASCASRIEQRLNRIEGMRAEVNFALERASVQPAELLPEAVEAIREAGYSARLEAEPELPASRSQRLRLPLSAALAVPVVALAMVPAWQFPGWQWCSLALALPVALWGAWPFHRAALSRLRHGEASMDTLVSIGVTAAMLWSLYALVWGHAGTIGMRHGFEWRPEPASGAGHVYFEVAAGVTVLLLAGRALEERAKRNAGAALRRLLRLGARDVELAASPEDAGERVPVERLAAGDTFRVRPGGRLPADGIVVHGRAAVDAAVLTGESVPVEVSPGDPVAGGTVNLDGVLLVRATGVGAESRLARMAAAVERAQSGKAAAQRLADRVAGVFVPVVLLVAVVSLAGWLLAGAGPEMAFTAAVSVLVIACPCALGLATPTAILAGTGRGAQIGVLVRGPEALERTARIDTAVLDKTGTLTSGRMSLQETIVFDERLLPGGPAEALRLAGALERGSEHPVARAIARAAEAAGPLPAAVGFRSEAGRGVRAEVAGRLVEAVRPERSPAPDGQEEALAAALERIAQAGATPVLLRVEGAEAAVFAVSDTVRPESAEAVAGLRALGIEPVLLSGDGEAPARTIAALTGIERVLAQAGPEDKLAEIERLRASGRRVAMIGDGVNDAAALAAADLGIAMGGGSDIAMEAGDLVLVRDDPRLAAEAVRLARAIRRTVAGNLFWAFAYNAAAIPLAALGMLNPMLAGAAMALSSLFVVLNSLRLTRFRQRVSGAERSIVEA